MISSLHWSFFTLHFLNFGRNQGEYPDQDLKSRKAYQAAREFAAAAAGL
jgi:hypothetical protein